MDETPESNESGAADDGSDDATEEIMRAVYLALSKHGYPETTMADIAEEFGKSKGLLYYHYESKEEILNDFFGYLCQQLETMLTDSSYDDPGVRLNALIDQLLPPEMDDEQLEFRQAFFEARSQAPHNRSYHEQIRRSDTIVLEALTETLEWGAETGRFDIDDPEQHAQLLFSTLYGIMERGTALEDRDLIERNRRALKARIEREALEDEPDT